MTGEEDQNDNNKGFPLPTFQRIQNTPCARESILYGAGGSLATGLLYFLATSRVSRSFDVGFAGFMITTIGSWCYCRYNNAMIRVQQRTIQDGIKKKIIYEGSAIDPIKKREAETPSSPS